MYGPYFGSVIQAVRRLEALQKTPCWLASSSPLRSRQRALCLPFPGPNRSWP